MYRRSRDAMRPSFAKALPQKEGAGNAGCTLHPRSRVQNCAKKRTRAYRFSGGNPAFPAQWLYGLCRALPGDEFVLSPSSADERHVRTRSGRHISADLTPATGARTTRFCRTRRRRRLAEAISLTGNPPCDINLTPTLPRPPHPIPTYLTIRIRPSLRDETAGFLQVIWGKREGVYFCGRDWTGQITLK
jgi:hypothetical protein